MNPMSAVLVVGLWVSRIWVASTFVVFEETLSII